MEQLGEAVVGVIEAAIAPIEDRWGSRAAWTFVAVAIVAALALAAVLFVRIVA